MGRKTGGGTHIHCHNQFNCINRLVKLGEFRYYYILTDWLVYISVMSINITLLGLNWLLLLFKFMIEWKEQLVWCESIYFFIGHKYFLLNKFVFESNKIIINNKKNL